MLRLQMGYPSLADERQILSDRATANPIETVKPVLTEADVLELHARVMQVRVDDALTDYLLQIVDATRKSELLELGVSPRGSLALFRSAQALALVEGRDYCIADDIKRLVLPCFAHRVIANSRSSSLRNRSREAESALLDILQKTVVPV